MSPTLHPLPLSIFDFNDKFEDDGDVESDYDEDEF